MEQPIPLKFEPSAPHTSVFSSFFSDDSLLTITPEKQDPFIFIKNKDPIVKDCILKNSRAPDQNFHKSKYPKSLEPEKMRNLLNNENNEYIYRNNEKSKHLEILQKEKELDNKKSYGASNEIISSSSKEMGKDYIDRKINDLGPKSKNMEVCKGPKVTFDQAISVRCFSPEESNISGSTDSNDSLHIQIPEKQKIETNLNSLASFYNNDNLSKIADKATNRLNKIESNYYLHKPYIDSLDNSLEVDNYAYDFSTEFYGSYNCSNNDKEFGSPISIQANDLLIDPLNYDSSLNDSPLVIPAVDLSILSLSLIESNDINVKRKNLFGIKKYDCSLKDSILESNSLTNKQIPNQFSLPTTTIDNIKSIITSDINSENGEKTSAENILKNKSSDLNEIPVQMGLNNQIKNMVDNEKENFMSNDGDRLSQTLECNNFKDSNIAEKPFVNQLQPDDSNMRPNANLKQSISRSKSNSKSGLKYSKSDSSVSGIKKNDNEDINVLAQAGLNSLLTLSKKVEDLKGQRFDEKSHINADIKSKIQEKALYKLNHPSSMVTFGDLPSLDVSKSELIVKKNHLADTNNRPIYLDKYKNHTNFKKPELLDFYSDDLFPQPAINYAQSMPNFLSPPKCVTTFCNFELADNIYTKFVKYSKSKYK